MNLNRRLDALEGSARGLSPAQIAADAAAFDAAISRLTSRAAVVDRLTPQQRASMSPAQEYAWALRNDVPLTIAEIMASRGLQPC